jgi:hypothetical protein
MQTIFRGTEHGFRAPMAQQGHGAHTDAISLARLTFTVDKGFFFDDIDNFTVQITARHIPEPSTFALARRWAGRSRADPLPARTRLTDLREDRPGDGA